LQHHREFRHPVGTARIARLGLQRIQVRVARRARALAVDAQVPGRTALLYPHPDARRLRDLPREQYPENLLLLDGTWSQASAMYRANAWLHRLPHVALQPVSESRYRIRRQPRLGCLSTIEALVQALRQLEPETIGLDGLLQVFDGMVQQQIQFERQQAGLRPSVDAEPAEPAEP
jgi:DTW domain-containing protein YfiP